VAACLVAWAVGEWAEWTTNPVMAGQRRIKEVPPIHAVQNVKDLGHSPRVFFVVPFFQLYSAVSRYCTLLSPLLAIWGKTSKTAIGL
jgi:hypothetical protein